MMKREGITARIKDDRSRRERGRERGGGVERNIGKLAARQDKTFHKTDIDSVLPGRHVDVNRESRRSVRRRERREKGGGERGKGESWRRIKGRVKDTHFLIASRRIAVFPLAPRRRLCSVSATSRPHSAFARGPREIRGGGVKILVLLRCA